MDLALTLEQEGKFQDHFLLIILNLGHDSHSNSKGRSPIMKNNKSSIFFYFVLTIIIMLLCFAVYDWNTIRKECKNTHSITMSAYSNTFALMEMHQTQM